MISYHCSPRSNNQSASIIYNVVKANITTYLKIIETQLAEILQTHKTFFTRTKYMFNHNFIFAYHNEFWRMHG